MPSNESDEHHLISRIARGDQDALQVLHARYRPRLRRYLWHQLQGDGALIEETLQDIFFAVWRSAKTFRGDAQVATWLFQIAHNRASRLHSAQARRPEGHLVRIAAHEDDEQPPLRELQVASYEEEVVARLALDDALQQLSRKHREVLTLIFQQGFAPGDVAAILAIPEGTVKSRVRQARVALQKHLFAANAPEDSR